jgi:uracil-DNA glycosylase
MNISEIIQDSLLIRNYLKVFEDVSQNPIDTRFLPVPPYKVSNDIKLIIIGQDPTIRNLDKRGEISCTLNLDKAGSIKKYIISLCEILEIEFENIYATNVFKYFYTIPPADTFEILQAHLRPNLKLLKREVDNFPHATVLTLGEPVLKLLVKDGNPVKMIHYWDYDSKEKSTRGDFKFISEEDNKICRRIYPLPHQPSIIKTFYANTIKQYISFVKSTSF